MKNEKYILLHSSFYTAYSMYIHITCQLLQPILIVEQPKATSCIEIQRAAAAACAEAKECWRCQNSGALDFIFIIALDFFCPLKALGGSLSPLTQKIAALGTHGKFPGNVGRDLHNGTLEG